MEQTETTPEINLMRAMMRLSKLGWHQQAIAGCKPSEIRILFCIRRGTSAHAPEMKVSEISKLLRVTSPTVTQLLNGLEANGLIKRHIDVEDRRAIVVTLTERGEAIAQQAADAFHASMHGLIEYLGEEQSIQLTELLNKVFRYFHEQEASSQYSQWNGEQNV